MSKSSHVELDFFGLHSLTNSMAHPPQPQQQQQPQPQPRLDRRQSFRGIAKINPEIVKSVIASANASKSSSSSHPGTPTSSLGMSQLPLFHPNPFSGEDSNHSMEKGEETAPMTIFYNGSVSVYDLPNDKAESIMKLAMEKNESKNEGKVVDYSCFKSSKATTKNILGRLNDDDDGDDSDMPIKRKKSLQRFFEKRKERLVSPYTNIEHMASGIEQQKA